jgi:L-fuculose-phosphate aldolase
MQFEQTRQQIADLGRRLEREGLLHFTAGNLSARVGPDQVAISPSGMPYGDISAEDVVIVNLRGDVVDGARRPSSEWRMHLAMYEIRPETGGVVHTHAPFATTLAVLGLPIPAVHYEIAALSDGVVPVLPYATYGTEALADHVRSHLGAANAALLANHGTIALGKTLGDAANYTAILEFLAMLYYQSRQIGDPVVLPREEILRVRQKFQTHGQPKGDI